MYYPLPLYNILYHELPVARFSEEDKFPIRNHARHRIESHYNRTPGKKVKFPPMGGMFTMHIHIIIIYNALLFKKCTTTLLFLSPPRDPLRIWRKHARVNRIIIIIITI